MQTLALGESSLRISRLAYGCRRLAGSGPVTPDVRAAGRRAIHAAIDAGFTLFDHADIYGRGVCEEIFGEVMKESPILRERLVIASKSGIRLPAADETGGPYRYDSRREHLITSCEASLRRLNVETLDLYQIHRPDFLAPPEEIAAAFQHLAEAGKVREFGVSNFRPSQLAALQCVCPFKLCAHQFECSLLQRAPLHDGTLDQCLAEKLIPLAWSPLGGGQLADRAGDLLRSQREYQPERVLPLLDETATRHGTTRSVVALAWLLKHPARIVPIIGTTDPARITGAVQALTHEFSHEDWYALLAAAEPAPLP